jgi:hypothetical protein
VGHTSCPTPRRWDIGVGAVYGWAGVPPTPHAPWRDQVGHGPCPTPPRPGGTPGRHQGPRRRRSPEGTDMGTEEGTGWRETRSLLPRKRWAPLRPPLFPPAGTAASLNPPAVRPTRAQRPISRPLSSAGAATSSSSGNRRAGARALMFDPRVFPQRSLTPSVTCTCGGVTSGPSAGLHSESGRMRKTGGSRHAR